MNQHNISTKDVKETLQVVTLAVTASIAAETLRWAGILLVAAKGGGAAGMLIADIPPG